MASSISLVHGEAASPLLGIRLKLMAAAEMLLCFQNTLFIIQKSALQPLVMRWDGSLAAG